MAWEKRIQLIFDYLFLWLFLVLFVTHRVNLIIIMHGTRRMINYVAAPQHKGLSTFRLRYIQLFIYSSVVYIIMDLKCLSTFARAAICFRPKNKYAVISRSTRYIQRRVEPWVPLWLQKPYPIPHLSRAYQFFIGITVLCRYSKAPFFVNLFLLTLQWDIKIYSEIIPMKIDEFLLVAKRSSQT